MYLSQFSSLQPTYLVAQADGLRWLSEAHSRHSRSTESRERMKKILHRYGCGPDKIERRGTFFRDFTHQNWSEMQIFSDQGPTMDVRMNLFQDALLQPVSELYERLENLDFKQWIHVSCTGYLSPSLIQIVNSDRGWGERVECLHAYHMGCYAAFPALRMARGNLDSEILHTELCTLHLDLASSDPEQLVIQSLFADGVIRYRATAQPPNSGGYEVLELREKVVSGTLDQMRWNLAASGFKMNLAREVPKSVQLGVVELIQAWHDPRNVYAIHPGGPRIIDAVQEALGLSDEQVYFSREVLRRHGNMSSATLPHVWQMMLSELAPGTPVISMAFGPGLTLSAGKMRRVGKR